MMQFKQEFCLPVDDCSTTTAPTSQSFDHPAIATLPHGSAPYHQFTQDSRQSTPTGVKAEDDEVNTNGSPAHLKHPHTDSANYIPGVSRMEPENLSFTDTLASTPPKRYDSFSTYDKVNMDLAQQSIHTLTLLNSFGIYNGTTNAIDNFAHTVLMMTPTRSTSGSDLADSPSPWLGEIQDSLNQFFGHLHMMDNMDPVPLDPSTLVMTAPEPLPETSSADAFQRQMMGLVPGQRSQELPKIQHRRNHKRAGRVSPRRLPRRPIQVVGAAKQRCDYPGCSKVFRRIEHLRRHRQTAHGEGPNRFGCEFCKKDQFNRQDNLNTHRKLHARSSNRNCSVEFIPEAVPIIEEEERSRKKRQPPKTNRAAQAG